MDRQTDTEIVTKRGIRIQTNTEAVQGEGTDRQTNSSHESVFMYDGAIKGKSCLAHTVFHEKLARGQ